MIIRPIAEIHMSLKPELTRVFVFLLVFGAAAAQKPPQTVLDYFLAVPDEYLGIAKNLGAREKAIKTRDLKNGYLRLENAWDGWGEVALFKNSDAARTLAVQTVGCGPACGTESLFFVQYKNNRWTDVTKKIMPEVGEDELLRVMRCINPRAESTVITYYELPRFGTTVKLIDDNAADRAGRVLYEFLWNGAKFTARSARGKNCRKQ